MTVMLYARRKEWPLERVEVRLTGEHIADAFSDSTPAGVPGTARPTNSAAACWRSRPLPGLSHPDGADPHRERARVNVGGAAWRTSPAPDPRRKRVRRRSGLSPTPARSFTASVPCGPCSARSAGPDARAAALRGPSRSTSSARVANSNGSPSQTTTLASRPGCSEPTDASTPNTSAGVSVTARSASSHDRP